MRLKDGTLFLAATDVANHLACSHLTELDRSVAEGLREKPDWFNPTAQLLRQRGIDHERAFIEHLRTQGLRTGEFGDGPEATHASTVEAMKDGADVIVQAVLENERWSGRSDLLLRVPLESELGDWSYEAADTKLSQETRAGTILQLALYSELLAEVQGRAPEFMHVVKPGPEFPQERFRFADFQAYYRMVRKRLETRTASKQTDDAYPRPVAHCDVCKWWKECDARRREDDNLCLVAGLGGLHVAELERQGIKSLEAFAESDTATPEKPKRGSVEAYERAQAQAKVQLRGRREERPVYEFRDLEDGRGFLRLPEPHAADVFFDIESDPFVDGGGLEYLLGYALRGSAGDELEFHGLWATTREEEKSAFEAFIDFVMERWKAHPGMHVYHFAPYEPAAVARLMGRHATRETEVDELLRAGKFVDLHAVTKQGLRASVERYSLKPLEAFFGFERAVELPTASAALRRVQCELELQAVPQVLKEDKELVEGYNRDDCLATVALQDWLEELRAELEREHGEKLPRPDAREGQASEKVEERAKEVEEVFEKLVGQLPESRADWTDAHEATWLLAHQLDYFRREDRCACWDFFHLLELDDEKLQTERKALSGLEFMSTEGGTARCPIHRYRFPEQECGLEVGKSLHALSGDRVGTVAAVDAGRQTVDIKKMQVAAAEHPGAVVMNARVVIQPPDSSVLELGKSVAANGVDGDGPYRAARDLLLRRPPRLAGGVTELRTAIESALDAAIRVVGQLDHGVLPIQGPPGSGKTFTGGRMILSLARQGKRVGVTAVSHKVIRNLLTSALEAAEEEGVVLEAAHKVRKKGDGTDGVEEVTGNPEGVAAVRAGKVFGATTWFWARQDVVEEPIDYLFVDEAGQMSLAHVLAAGRAAKNLVLLGDPRQLEQPQRGAHPEGAEVAALAHVLNGNETMPEGQGLFLEETWRLSPALCDFTSEVFYEGRLKPRVGTEQQRLVGETPFEGSGLFYVPVEHEGNQQSSDEEVAVVVSLVEELCGGGVRWVDSAGVERVVTREDVLVVAPYNAQVTRLADRLPGVSVGTVDKFQGQQAAVVVYSMAASSAEDAPRGMEFLFSPNRTNVATSRARCACILVATPQLFQVDCRTPQQMRWANGLCRFREMANTVDGAAVL